MLNSLYHILRAMFIPGQSENDNTNPVQLTLF